MSDNGSGCVRSLSKFGVMKWVSILAILFLGLQGASSHPLHLSITNITYENGMLNVSMKTFVDDWETAYFHYHSRVIDFSDPQNRSIPWFGDYLKRCFRISPGKEREPFDLTVQNITLGEDYMTIEMTAGVRGHPKSLYLYHALLIDIYPDQTNLLIFGMKDRETGIKFDVINQEETVLLK